MDFMMDLSRRNLFFNESLDFPPINICLTFKSTCFRFSLSGLSKSIFLFTCVPRYSVLVNCGIWTLFCCDVGLCSFYKVKLICTVLISLIWIFHLLNHICKRSRLLCRIVDAFIESSCYMKMNVSSANVRITMFLIELINLSWFFALISTIFKRQNKINKLEMHYVLAENCFRVS